MAGYNPLLWAQQQAAGGANATAAQGAVLAATPSPVPPAPCKARPAAHATAAPMQLPFQPFPTPNLQPQADLATSQPPITSVTPTVAAYVPPHLRKQATPHASDAAKPAVIVATQSVPAARQLVQQQQQLPYPAQPVTPPPYSMAPHLHPSPQHHQQEWQAQQEQQAEDDDDEVLLGMLLGASDAAPGAGMHLEQQQEEEDEEADDQTLMQAVTIAGQQQSTVDKDYSHLLQPQLLPALQPSSQTTTAALDLLAAPHTPTPPTVAAGHIAKHPDAMPVANSTGVVHEAADVDKTASSSGSSSSGASSSATSRDGKAAGMDGSSGSGSSDKDDSDQAVGTESSVQHVQQLLFGSVGSGVLTTQGVLEQQQQQEQEKQQQETQQQQGQQKAAWNRVMAWDWMLGYAPKVGKAVTAELYDLLAETEQQISTDAAACTLYFALARNDDCGPRLLSQARHPTLQLRASMVAFRNAIEARPRLAAALAELVVQRPDVVVHFDRLMMKRLLEQNTEEVALQVISYYMELEEEWEKQCVTPSKWLMGVIARLSGWKAAPGAR